jgi:hypothetical protein
MHWELLIIPLIALGVWILGTLFKGGEDERFKNLGRKPGGGGGRLPPRRPVTDLDRFLEEARLRREAEERRQAPPPLPARPTMSRPPLRERPAPPRETPVSRNVPPPQRKGEVSPAIPVARPIPKAVLEEPILLEPVAEPAPARSVVPATTRETRPSPLLQQVRSLLSKPQSARTAFALREIFAPPLCRRRRG